MVELDGSGGRADGRSGTAVTLAERFRESIARAADAIEAGSALPEDLVGQMKAAGVFRQLIPTSLGGLGCALPDFVRSLEVTAAADASTAWCVAQGAVIATTSLWLPERSARALWSDPDCAIANGPPRGSTATPDGANGYRVSGHWGFSSGCAHATWMHGALRRSTDGAWMGVYFPKEAARFHDNWQVAGLRGTGSLEFSVTDLPVSAEWVTDFRRPPIDSGTLYRIPAALVFAVSFGAVALGVARAGMDAVVDLAQGKVPGYQSATLKDDPDMQKLIGEAAMRWRSARAFLRETVDEVWEAVGSQEGIVAPQRIDLRMAGTHAINEAAAVLDLAYRVAGSSAIYRTNPLQRRFQDMHVISQHVQARPSHYGVVGRYVLGHPFKPGPMI
jgi:alkylation response protein AidB-like acyl-CoA dehydrogenase